MLRGKDPPGPESGWEAIHAIEQNWDCGLQKSLKLVNPQPEIDRSLEEAGFKQSLEIYPNLEIAISSINSKNDG
jgi:anti-anti-sigma regulatory factor